MLHGRASTSCRVARPRSRDHRRASLFVCLGALIDGDRCTSDQAQHRCERSGSVVHQRLDSVDQAAGGSSVAHVGEAGGQLEGRLGAEVPIARDLVVRLDRSKTIAHTVDASVQPSVRARASSS